MVKKYYIWFLIVLFGLIYNFYSIIRHLRFGSFIFDLGVYDQIIWLASRGKPLFSSVLETHPWGDHLTPSLLLLVPLYWLWDNVIILLFFQAFFTAFGAFPIYKLALKKIKSYWLSLLIAFAYLIFYGIQNAIAFDFHPIVLATTLLAWLFWLYEEKKSRLFWLVLVLFVGLQENFFLLAAALGIFLIVYYRDFKRGSIIAVLNIVLFFLTVLVIIPHFGKAQFTYLPTHFKSLTIWQAVKMLFYPYTKVQVMTVSLLAFGFLPVFSPAIFIILLEEFFQRFVGSPISTRWNLAYQYNSILAPVLAFGAIESVRKIFFKKKKLTVLLIFGGILSVQILTKPSLNDLIKKDFYNFSRNKDTREILALIPKDASVAATNNLGPHLTHREKLIFLANCHDDPTAWKNDMKRCFNLKPDYLVADLDPNGNRNNFYPDESWESLLKYLMDAQSSGEYNLVKQQNNIYLLKRNIPLIF